MITRFRLIPFYRPAFIMLMITVLGACSTMQPTHYGFNDVSVMEPNVRWQLEHNSLTKTEKAEIEAYVSQLMNERYEQVENRNLAVQAQITRIETVDPFLNLVSAVLVILPLDRGGAAIELQATELKTGKTLHSASYAKWMPRTKFKAHFSRTALAKLALKDSIDEFFNEIGLRSGATIEG